MEIWDWEHGSSYFLKTGEEYDGLNSQIFKKEVFLFLYDNKIKKDYWIIKEDTSFPSLKVSST